MLGADFDHLLDLGHQRVRLVAMSLHVPAKILGSVPQETDIVELVSFLVGNARLVRVTVVGAGLGFLVHSNEVVQGGLLLDETFIGGGLGRPGDQFELVRVGES